jgi:hypothetical protein
MGQGLVHFIGAMARESTMKKMSAPKKNCEGFTMFFIFKNFKRAFMGDVKQW